MAVSFSFQAAFDTRQVVDGAEKGERAFKEFGDSADRAGVKTRTLAGTASASLAPLISAFGGLSAAVLATKLVSKISEFEQLRARLESVTGSTTAAAQAFDMVTKLASKTPFSVQTLADVFARLEAQGITPTEQRLISFGNVAAAMGKDITQFAEAVLDAQTGEFERLKEFGIKASVQGEKVALTFKGVTTTIGKNSAEIVSYFQRIGDTQFAGAMERQAHTLAGAWSNLGDVVSNTADRIGRSGLGEQLGDILRSITGWIGSVSENWDALASGMWQAMAVTVEKVGGGVTWLLGFMSKAFSGIDTVVGKMSFLPGATSAKEQTEKIAESYREMFESSRDFTADMSSGLRMLSDEAMARFEKSLERGAKAEDKLSNSGHSAGEAAKKLAKVYADLGAAHDARVADLQAQIAAVGRGTMADRQAAIAIETRARAAKLGAGATAEMVKQIELQVAEEINLKDALDAATAALETRKEIAEVLSKIDIDKKLTDALVNRGLPAFKQMSRDAEVWAAAIEKTGGELNEQTLFWANLIGLQKEASAEVEFQRGIEEGIGDTAKRVAEEQADAWKREREEAVRVARARVEQIGGLGRALQDGMAGANDQFSVAVSGIGRMIEGLAQAKLAVDDIGRSDGFAMMAQGLSAIVQASGVLSQNVTSGGFGARGEGNYAAEGSTVGAVVGAVIGAYFGNPQAGMAIGSAAGGILGSFIQKGAQEALATSVDGINGVALMVTKSEGGLGRVISEIGFAINEALLSIMDVLGGAIEDLPEVSAKVRDGIITMVVGGVKGKFKEMDDAIGFAVTELLKQGDITGMSDTIRKILSQTAAPDINALTRDLEFGQWYDRLGLDEAAEQFLDAMTAFRSRLRQAIKFGLDTEPIYAELGRDLSQIRNQILGINESEEDRIRRQAASYNAQAMLFIAEQEAKKADLEIQKAALTAKVELLRAESGLTQESIGIAEAEARLKRSRIAIDAEYVGAGYQILDAEYDLYENKLGLELGAINTLAQALYQLGAVTDAIAAIDDILANIQLISPGDIDAAIGRIGSGSSGSTGGFGGQSAEDRLAEFNKQMAALRLEELPDTARQVEEIRSRFAALRATATELGQSTDELDRIEGRRLDAIRAARQQENRQFALGSGGGTDWQRQLDEIGVWFGQAIDAATASGEDMSEVFDAFQGRIGDLRDTVLSSLSPTYAAAKQMRDLGASIKWAEDNAERLGISEQQLGQIRAEQEQTFFLDMAENIARRLGDEQLLADLAQARYTLEIASMRTQIELARANHVITQTTYDYLLGILDRLPDTVPAGTTGGTGGGGYTDGSPGGNVNETYDRIQDALRRLAEFENQRPGENATARRIRELNEEFANLRSILGDTARVQAAYANALQAIITEALEPLRDLGRELAFSSVSPFTRMQQYQLAASEYQQVAAAAQAGDWNAIERLPDVARRYLELFGGVAGTSGAGYVAAYNQVMALIAQLTGQTFPTAGSGGGGLGTGTGTGRNDTGGPRVRASALGASQFATDVRTSDVRASGVESRLESVIAELRAMKTQMAELAQTERARLADERRGASARRVA